jgi:hypothetical protein
MEVEQKHRTVTIPSKAATKLITQLEYLIFRNSFKRFGDTHPRGLFPRHDHVALAGEHWVSLFNQSDEYEWGTEPSVFC